MRPVEGRGDILSAAARCGRDAILIWRPRSCAGPNGDELQEMHAADAARLS
jgi:hypothetical protein